MLDAAAFITLFPEFADRDPALISARLESAARMMNVDFFGAAFDDAQGYYTAHLLATLNSAAASGAVEVQAGSARVRFRENFNPNLLGYFAEYLRIVKGIGGGPYLAQEF